MPELPEVETIRRDLLKKILRKKITAVFVSNKAQLNKSRAVFIKAFKRREFLDINRIGKLLIFVLKKNKYLLLHLKMTGQLVYRCGRQLIAGGHPEPSPAELPNQFTRVVFTFTDGSKLYFNDIRRFGYLQIVDEADFEKVKSKFGIEPLAKEFTLAYLKEVLANKNKPIKVALMNQDKIAGIGNIYASEICFEAKIRPQRKANSLSEKELSALRKASVKVLKIAVKNRGTTFSDYVDAEGRGGYHARFLKVYGRQRFNCKRQDGGMIAKINLDGRSSFYCPICQK